MSIRGTVAVGIPFYRHANPAHLEEAICSILQQTRRPDALVLIQDGDVSEELQVLVAKYEAREGVQILRLFENRGLAHAINESLKFVQTTYYARMDADDVAEPERLKEQLAYFEMNPRTDIVGTWALDVAEDGTEISFRKTPIGHDNILRYIWTCPLLHPTVMFKRESILGVGGYNPKLKRRQDYELWFRCAEAGLRFGNVPKYLLRYRFTEQTFSRNNPRVVWQQVRIGWKGCYRIRAKPIAYFGVLVPFGTSLFPRRLRMRINTLLRYFDPRNRSVAGEGVPSGAVEKRTGDN